MPTDDPGTLVRQALEHLHNQPYLETHALARRLGVASLPLTGAAVRQRLLGAIEQLRPPRSTAATVVDWRRYQHIVLRYVEGHGLDRVIRELAVSPRQASRDHHEAIASLVTLLRLESSERSAASVTEDDGATPQDVTPTDLAEVVRGAVATLRKLRPDPRRRIDLSLSDTLPPVALDRALLRQAILHLLISATSRPGAHLALTASDTPRGVTVRLRSESFQEASPRGGDATLAVDVPDLVVAARTLLAREAGTIEGEGDPRCPESWTMVLPPARLRTLLVVDDNPDVAALFRRYLRGQAVRTLQATTGPSALKIARELRPSAIILDVLLPGEDGWELLADLRRAPGLHKTPVIVCSVLPERTLARSLGVAEFLPKPVTRAALIAALERWCPARTANRARPAATA